MKQHDESTQKQTPDEHFRIRPGRPRPEHGHVPRGVTGFGRLAQAAVTTAAREGARRKAAPGGYRIRGRQRLVAAPRAVSQQVVVQSHICYHRGARPAVVRERIATRVAYLSREGAGAGAGRAKLFGSREATPEMARAFAHDAARAPHTFRFIVSPEHAAALDLEIFSRDLMRQLGDDLGVEPDWIAAAHYDTEQPHVHIELAGVDRSGARLRIHEDYLFKGLRYRAQELATKALGYRTEAELCAALGRAVTAPRVTTLDRSLLDLAQGEEPAIVRLSDVRKHARSQRQVAAPAMEHYLRERLRHLQALGLARPVTTARTELAPDLKARLQTLARRGDILKTLQRADAEAVRAQDLRLWDRRQMVGRWIEGRVAARAFADELTDKELLVVEATDGVAHVVPLNATSDQLGRTRDGDLVRVSGGRAGFPNVYLQARLSLDDQVRAPGRTWLDDKLLQDARSRGQKRDIGDGAEGAQARSVSRAGFRREVAAALAARRAVLQERGLLEGRAGRDRLAPRFLATLYAAELDAFHHEHGHKLGTRRRFVAGVEAAGRLEIVQLSSGPHALLRDRAGYHLTPLRPGMVPHVGQEVGITLSAEAIQRPLDRSRPVQVRALGRDRERGR